jgi:predicted methyltransferase
METKRCLKILNQQNSLDATIVLFVLHDMYLNNEMSDQILDTLLTSLKKVASLVILDNTAKHATGLTGIGYLHRVGENFVKDDIVKAGCIFHNASEVLRNTEDNHNKT